MMVPLDIVFRKTDVDACILDDVNQYIKELDQLHDSIIACHVIVDALPRLQTAGHLYQVRIQLSLPCHEITIGHRPQQRATHENVRAAVRNGFRLLREDLTAWIKGHSAPDRPRLPAHDRAVH